MSTDPARGQFIALDRRRRVAESAVTSPAPFPGSSFLGRDLSESALRAPAPPSFDLSAMAVARQEGFDLGRAAGLAEADASLLAERTRALGMMASLMADADARAADVSDRAAKVLAAALLGSLRAMMPDLVARSALGEASAMLAAVLPGLSREPAVRVAVPPVIADGVRASIASVPGRQSHIEVEALEAMAPGGVSVTWTAGKASRVPSEVWDAVMQHIAPLMGAGAAEDASNV